MKCKEKELTLLTILQPILVVNQFLGVCPHSFKGDIPVFRWRSATFLKTLFTIIVLCLHLSFTTFQFYKALLNGQNMVKLSFLFAWMTGPFISICILCVTIQKRHEFTGFFTKLQEFQGVNCMQGISNCRQVVRVAWRFYAFYMLLALSCAIQVGWDTLQHPGSEIYFLHYFPLPSNLLISLNCFYQFYLVVITQSACALVEVFSASVSVSLVNKIRKIHSQMKEGLNQTEAYAGSQTKKPDLESPKIPYYHSGPLVQLESTDDLKKVEYSALALNPEEPKEALTTNTASSSSTAPIILAIQRFSYIAQKQRLINSIFGPILALDIAWLVIHVCLLFFLQIKSLGLAASSTTDLPGPHATHETPQRVALFAGQGIIYLIRLLIVLISLGNVHQASTWLDVEIASSLMNVKKPKASDINLIQVHLLGSQANPVAFSAGGFFILSRGTLLYAFSIITTYIVFLLQA